MTAKELRESANALHKAAESTILRHLRSIGRKKYRVPIDVSLTTHQCYIEQIERVGAIGRVSYKAISTGDTVTWKLSELTLDELAAIMKHLESVPANY